MGQNVGIVGLGYVGLPLAWSFYQNGDDVTGLDINTDTVDLLSSGKSHIKHFSDERVDDMINGRTAGGTFRASTNMERLASMHVIIICVPTPLTENREPDLKYVVATCNTIGRWLSPGTLVVLESTTYPGTTRDVMLPILEDKSGLKIDDGDFFLAYSPEREDPGNPDWNTRTIPKLVGGINDRSLGKAMNAYRGAIYNIVPVDNCEIAEAAKIIENTYRCVNIAMVNELKIVFDRMGIDVWKVIDAAATKPFGYKAFYPGPGLGGHCIPIDPFYLTWKARQYGIDTKFIELAGQINTSMPEYVVSRTMDALNHLGKPMRHASILVLGLAYKPDIDDVRESPTFRLIELYEAKGGLVEYNDPFCPMTHEMRSYPGEQPRLSVDLDYDDMGTYDVVVIATNHSQYDYQAIVDNAKLVIDTRNACKDVRDRNGVVFKA